MRTPFFAMLAAALLPSALSAQSATYEYFGTGYCATPSFTVTGLPVLGGSFAVETPGSYSGFFQVSQSLLITGVSDQTWSGLPLPYAFPGFCGPLLASVESLKSVASVPTPGTLVSTPLTIPNDANLLGASFYQQVVQIEQLCGKIGCNPPDVRLTRGGHGVVGY